MIHRHDPSALEITAHRIGGEDGYPRTFGPWVHPVTLSAITSYDLSSKYHSHIWLSVTLSDWTRVDDEWLSCRIELADMNGAPLGTRPALVFSQPYDIPTHVHFPPRHPDAGAFALGLRIP